LQLSETLIAIADDLSTHGDHTQALEYYTEAIRWDDTVPRSYVKRGECYQALQRPANVLADFTHALELDPTSDEAKLKLGYLHDSKGVRSYNDRRFVDADVEFTAAVAVTDIVPLFFFHRAKCRLMMPGAYSKAQDDLLQCVKLGATETEILKMVHQHCLPLVREQQHEAKSVYGRYGEPQFVVVKDLSQLPPSMGTTVYRPRRVIRPALQPELDAARIDDHIARLRVSQKFRTGKSDVEALKTKATSCMRHSNISKDAALWASSVQKQRKAAIRIFTEPIFGATATATASTSASSPISSNNNGGVSGNSSDGLPTNVNRLPFAAANSTCSSTRCSRLAPPRLSVRELRELKR
jgi:tetratricopeptide (TPR) repeat protein